MVSTPSEPSTAGLPQPRKSWRLPITIAAVLLFSLLVIIAVFWFFSRQQKLISDAPAVNLPEPASASPFARLFSESATPLTTTEPLISPAAFGKNLAVSFSYTREKNSNIKINKVAKVNLPANTQYLPVSSQYIWITVADVDGKEIFKTQYSMPTRLAVDGPNNGGVIDLSDQSDLIIFAMQPDDKPAKVQFVSVNGNVLEENVFNFEQLPLESWPEFVPDTAQVRGARVLAGGTRAYNIAVVNDLWEGITAEGASAAVSLVSSQVEMAVRQIDPWKQYVVSVRPLANTTWNFRCTPTKLNGLEYPRCPYTGYIQSIVNSQHVPWDVIIVVTSVVDNSGSVGVSGSNFSSVIAVGKIVSFGVIAHELGHATGQMTDEYVGDILQAEPAPDGPNCFATHSQCDDEIEPYLSDGGAQCSEHCNSPSTYRPSNMIMYNQYAESKYGPFETCLLDRKLAQAVGGTTTFCKEKPSPSPSPDSPESSSNPAAGDYWGWHR